MALNSGFPRIEASNNTFSDWLNKTNEMIDLFRDDTVTANSSGANTFGNARILGEFSATTLIAHDELRGGDLFSGNSANLSIVSNTIFTTNCDLVTIESDLRVDTDSLFLGNVQAQSTVQFANNDSAVEFKGANQDFIWLSTNTHATIRTNAIGSLELNADVAANATNDSSIVLKVDSVNVASFAEGGNIAFYTADGTSEKIKWDATNQVLGVNTASPQTDVALDVAGNTQTTDLVVTNEITANVITIENSLKGSANLAIVSNTDFSSNVVMADDLTINGTLTITDLNYTLIPDDYNNLIPNLTSGRLLGNTVNRWEGYFTDVDVSIDLTVGGNVTVTDTITTDTLVVTNSAALPSAITFTGVTEFEDITVTGTASFANLEVGSLTTNTAGIIGTSGSVSTTSPTKIDEFDKTVSKGFKYIIHGENGDSTSAYAIEINCSHNGTDVYYTRFGEVSNNFDAVVVPQINGGNVELIATCSSAGVGNTHNFNIVRIETR